MIRGQFERGAAARITGMAERSARRLLGDVISAGLLASDKPKGPVSLRFPADCLDVLFPRLYPPVKASRSWWKIFLRWCALPLSSLVMQIFRGRGCRKSDSRISLYGTKPQAQVPISPPWYMRLTLTIPYKSTTPRRRTFSTVS